MGPFLLCPTTLWLALLLFPCLGSPAYRHHSLPYTVDATIDEEDDSPNACLHLCIVEIARR